MKTTQIALTLFGLLISSISLNSQAVIVEGKFSGSVLYSLEGEPEFGYTSIWDGDIVGTSASGSFWYDTDKAPENNSTFENTAQHIGFTNDWMHITFNIDGKTFDISDNPGKTGDMEDHEQLWMYNHEQAVNGSNIEMYYLSDRTNYGSFDGYYHSKGGIVEFYSYDYPVLNGTDIVQEFSWTDNGDPNYFGQATFGIGGVLENEKTSASVSMTLSSFSVGIKKTAEVPEPSALLLFAIGLLGLGWRFKNGYSQQ